MTQPSWLVETRYFFFAGVRSGWAGGNSGSPFKRTDGTPGMEDWREAIYLDAVGFPGFHFADRWGIDPDSGKPSGSIFITHWNIPVWSMWVGGNSYDKQVFPFLREALTETYSRNVFCGGRGPAEYRKDNLLYTNVYEGDFSRFKGRECIEYVAEDGTKQSAGSHDYWGGSFVFLPRT